MIKVTQRATYAEAKEICDTEYDGLASITTDEDIEKAIYAMDGDEAAWIGLRSTKEIGWFELEEENNKCPDVHSGACVDFWVIGHPRCVIDEEGRTEYEEGYSGDGYSFVAFSDGKVDNDKPGTTLRPFLCNYIAEAAEFETTEFS